MADFPVDKILNLSDAFEHAEGKGNAALDLSVKVININKGCNPELEQRSQTLDGYICFIAKIRELQRELTGKVENPLDEALKRAIDYCKEQDILREFLTEHSSEVRNMLFTEWNWDDALEVREQEGFEMGIEEMARLIEEGYTVQEAKKILKEKHPLVDAD